MDFCSLAYLCVLGICITMKTNKYRIVKMEDGFYEVHQLSDTFRAYGPEWDRLTRHRTLWGARLELRRKKREDLKDIVSEVVYADKVEQN